MKKFSEKDVDVEVLDYKLLKDSSINFPNQGQALRVPSFF